MALTELAGRVAVELERHGQWRLGIGAKRTLSRCRRRGLGDAPHGHRVVISAREESLSGRCAQGGGMESGVFQPLPRQPLGSRSMTRTSEGTRCAESDVIQQ